MRVYVSVNIDLNIKTNARKLVKFKIFIMGSSATSLCSNNWRTVSKLDFNSWEST